jgi:asparagine synthase (glutamine-hydrolysing)
LRDWAEDLLDAKKLATGGLIEAEPVRALWADHLAGRDRQFPLWDVLMLEAWRRRWMA